MGPAGGLVKAQGLGLAPARLICAWNDANDARTMAGSGFDVVWAFRGIAAFVTGFGVERDSANSAYVQNTCIVLEGLRSVIGSDIFRGRTGRVIFRAEKRGLLRFW